MSSLVEALEWVKPWFDYVQRLRSKAYDPAVGTGAMEADTRNPEEPVSPQCRVREWDVEGSTRRILNNVVRKVALLMGRFDIETEDHAWDLFLQGFEGSYLAEMERALFDKFLLGLGWIALEKTDPDQKEPRFAYVDPCEVVWDPHYRIDVSPVYWRRITLPRAEVKRRYPDIPQPRDIEFLDLYIEYTQEKLRVIDKKGKEYSSEPNPCQDTERTLLPIRPLCHVYPGGLDVPFSDWELCRGNEQLLDETRQMMVHHARRARTIAATPRGAFLGNELQKVTDQTNSDPVAQYEMGSLGGRPPLEVFSTGVIEGDWLGVGEQAQRDLDESAAISAFDRLTTPERKVEFATEAQLIAQKAGQYAQKTLEESRADAEWAMTAVSVWSAQSFPPGGRPLRTKEGDMLVPKEPPVWMEIRTGYESTQRQQLAMALLKVYQPQIAAFPVDVESLFRMIWTYLGMSGKEVDSLKAKVFDASSPAPQPFATAPENGGSGIEQPSPEALMQLLGQR